ncbi:MAG TPA: hypothetical protein VF807_08560 [Ktedonobacterales bacterium]
MPHDDNAHDGSFDPAEYDLLLQVERLESLEEEMAELGIATIDDLRARIAALHRQLGER